MDNNNKEKIKKVETKLNERSVLEELVYHLTNENFNDAKKLISKYVDNQKWILRLLSSAALVNPFKFKLLGDLFALTGKPKRIIEINNNFQYYLFVRGLAQEDLRFPPRIKIKQINDYEEPIKKDTLEFYIYTDNAESFISYVNTQNIDIKKEYKIDVNDMSFNSITEFACFCGSMNIMKFLFDNSVEIKEKTIEYAIQSGSKEMIEYFEQKGYSSDKSVYYAIEVHQNEIARWIFEKSPVSDFSTHYCICEVNTELFLYFFNLLNPDINEQDGFKDTLLHWSVLNNREVYEASQNPPLPVVAETECKCQIKKCIEK